MSPRKVTQDAECQGFPRVSGDEPGTMPGAGPSLWFSPRERG